MAEYRGVARIHQQPGQPANVQRRLPGPDLERRNHEKLCLDAGGALLLFGALVTMASAFDAANTTLVFVGFFLWILGACLCLLALTPAAPWAVTVASTVLKYLYPPVNYY